MSVWQGLQDSEFMKNSEVMGLPSAVCAELGKARLPAPPPSASMLSGAVAGLRMMYCGLGTSALVNHHRGVKYARRNVTTPALQRHAR